MARYRVTKKSFINNTIVEEGEEVEYSGEPGSNLELIGGGNRDDKHQNHKHQKTKGPDRTASNADDDALI
jgi:hypothetical protein